MRGKKLADLFVVAAFLAFLALALTVTLLRPKEGWSYFENRLLAQPPELTAQTLLDGTFTGSVESVLQDHAAGRNTLLKFSTWLDLDLLHRPVVNQVIPAGDMLLYQYAYETVDPAAVSAQAQAMGDRLAQLRDLVESYGGVYCYVAIPGQYGYFAEKYPMFLNSRSEYDSQVVPAFTEALAGRGVNLLDMGTVFDALGNPASFYSTVDHHYTFEGAYETYLAIMEVVNGALDTPLTVLEGDAITFETLPNRYLGSNARKLFGLWETTEAAVLGWPAQAIPFTRTDNGVETAAAVYSLPANQWEDVLYSVYMGGDIAETVIDTGRDDLPSLLIYGDSFTNPLEGLLYYSFDETRCIDLRLYKEMTLAQYIELHQPDVVLCVRDYEVLLEFFGNGNVFALG